MTLTVVTPEVRQKMVDVLGININDLPSGKLITSGEHFDEASRQYQMAIEAEADMVPEGTKPLGILSSDITAYDFESEVVKTINPMLVITDDSALFGVATGNSVVYFSKNQWESLKTLVDSQEA